MTPRLVRHTDSQVEYLQVLPVNTKGWDEGEKLGCTEILQIPRERESEKEDQAPAGTLLRTGINNTSINQCHSVSETYQLPIFQKISIFYLLTNQ